MRNYHPEFGVATTIITVVLFAIVVGGSTWLGRRRIARLQTRRAVDPAALTRTYQRSLATWWPITVVAVVMAALDPGLGLTSIGLALPDGPDAFVTWLLAVGITALAVFGYYRRRALFAGLDELPPPLHRVATILPATAAERQLAIGVAVTAGVCEEVVFRGLLIAAGVGILGLSLWGSLLLSAALFGLGHLYQGRLRAAGAAVAGLLLGMLYVVSGDLLLSITAHVAVDLVAFLTVPFALVAKALGIGQPSTQAGTA